MTRCPQCSSSLVHEEDSEEDYRGEDEFTTIIKKYFTCQDCQCEFTEIHTETVNITIDKKGTPTFQSQ